MLAYVSRRFALAVPTVFLVALVVFTLMRLIPGDPVQVMMGEAGSQEQVAEARRLLGLDQPLPVQFANWLSLVGHGDLGRSLVNNLPVLSLVLERAKLSAIVVFLSVGLATLVAVPLGLLAAWRHNTKLDLALVTGATLMLSIPSFWLGLMLLLLFGLELGWVPVVGFVPFSQSMGQASTFLVLPILTLCAVEVGTLLRMSRGTGIEVLGLEFVTHARAKGLSEGRILFRHVLPNAFAPTWTVIGLMLGHLLGGIAVLETVFTLPGLGRLLIESIFARDYPVIQGCLLFTALAYVLINLVVDLCYPLFDPRVAVE